MASRESATKGDTHDYHGSKIFRESDAFSASENEGMMNEKDGAHAEKRASTDNDDFLCESVEEDIRDCCPLFMDGLPHDFARNPHLAAIASLLESDNESSSEAHPKEEEERTNRPKITPNGGGGKVKPPKGRKERKALIGPYSTKNQDKSNKGATMGEAQLFLKMWRL